jgi:hypothetical protein
MARVQRIIPPVVEYTAEQVWAASCAAFRINGSYIKVVEYIDVGPSQMRNRDLMSRILQDNSITPTDIEQGINARQYFQGLLLKQITGNINGFEQNTLRCAGMDTIRSNDYLTFSIIASLPASYNRSVERDRVKEEMSFLLENSRHFGSIGDKVQLDVEVVRTIYSTNYNIHFVTAVADKNVVFFSFKENLQPGTKMKIAGTIKQFRDEGQTQLNRVRAIK